MSLGYDQVSAITRKKFIPKMYDNIFDSNVLLMRLKKKSYEKLDGGEKIVVPLNYAMVTASGWYSGADTLSTTDNEVMTAAEYLWKQLYVNITITRSDELKNSGDSRVLSLVKNKIKIAEKTMKDKLGTGIYSDGSTANQIAGLRAICSTTSTVGNISQSTYSWWQAQVDSTSTTLTLAVMQNLFNDATVDNDSPTVGVCTRTILDSYYNLLTPQQRFTSDETGAAGFKNLMFNGIPIVADSYCPASNLFLLNEDHLHLYAHKQEDMRFEDFQKPVNQNVKVGKIYWMGALGSSNNRLHARASALTA